MILCVSIDCTACLKMNVQIHYYGHFALGNAAARYEGAVLSWFYFMLVMILFRSDSSNKWLCNVVITFLTYALLWQKEARCFEVNEVTEIVQTVVGCMSLGCRGTSKAAFSRIVMGLWRCMGPSLRWGPLGMCKHVTSGTCKHEENATCSPQGKGKWAKSYALSVPSEVGYIGAKVICGWL